MDTPAEGISDLVLVIIGTGWVHSGPKNVIGKIHYFGEHSLLGYASLPCSGRMSENLVTQNSFSSESALRMDNSAKDGIQMLTKDPLRTGFKCSLRTDNTAKDGIQISLRTDNSAKDGIQMLTKDGQFR